MDLEVVCNPSTGQLRPSVPETLRRILLSSMDNSLHPDANASIQLVSDRLVWSRMKTDIHQWAKPCVPCQKAKMRRYTRSTFGSFPLLDEQFAHMHVDITGTLPICEDQSYL